MNHNTDYYADTAFNLSKLYQLPEAKHDKLGLLQRRMRKNLLPRGIICGEFLALSFLSWVGEGEAAPNALDRKLIIDKEQPHDIETFECLRSIHRLLGVVIGFAALFFFLLGFCGSIMAYFSGYSPSTKYYAITVALPLLLILACVVIMRSLNRTETHNDTMSRRTGLVYVGRWFGFGERWTRPFVDFDGVWYYIVNPAAGTEMYLRLFHRNSKVSVQSADALLTDGAWKAALHWEYYQAFMDISRPLPDIPELEAVRHRDPVTAAYDEQTGRDPYYWRNMDLETAEAMKEAARKRAEVMLDPARLNQRVAEQKAEGLI